MYKQRQYRSAVTLKVNEQTTLLFQEILQQFIISNNHYNNQEYEKSARCLQDAINISVALGSILVPDIKTIETSNNHDISKEYLSLNIWREYFSWLIGAIGRYSCERNNTLYNNIINSLQGVIAMWSKLQPQERKINYNVKEANNMVF